jgi:hypothetical protein
MLTSFWTHSKFGMRNHVQHPHVTSLTFFLIHFSFHLEKPESWSAWGFDSLAPIGAFCMKYNKFNIMFLVFFVLFGQSADSTSANTTNENF